MVRANPLNHQVYLFRSRLSDTGELRVVLDFSLPVKNRFEWPQNIHASHQFFLNKQCRETMRNRLIRGGEIDPFVNLLKWRRQDGVPEIADRLRQQI